MNGTAVFLLAYFGTLGTAAIVFLGWYYRYAFRSGYFKATFLDESGETIDRIFRPKLKTNEKGEREFSIKIKGRGHTFGYDTAVMYRSRKWRLPHSFYVLGKYAPIDYKKAILASGAIASDRYHEVATNSVTSQLIHAFDSETITTTMAFALIAVLMLGGFLIIGFFINSRITDVLTAMGVAS